MININELMIGNIVQYVSTKNEMSVQTDVAFRVGAIDKFGNIKRITFDGPTMEYRSGEYGPIEITEDWLYRLGFFMCDYKKYKCGVFVYDLQEKLLTVHGYIFTMNKNLYKYVHQLQNACFVLSGELLTVKL